MEKKEGKSGQNLEILIAFQRIAVHTTISSRAHA